jgi:hypothetical protein
LNDDERRVWILTDKFFYSWAKSAGVKFWERRWNRLAEGPSGSRRKQKGGETLVSALGVRFNIIYSLYFAENNPINSGNMFVKCWDLTPLRPPKKWGSNSPL